MCQQIHKRINVSLIVFSRLNAVQHDGLLQETGQTLLFEMWKRIQMDAVIGQTRTGRMRKRSAVQLLYMRCKN